MDPSQDQLPQESAPMFTLNDASSEAVSGSNTSNGTMKANDIPTTSSVMGTTHSAWMTPTIQPRQRPATIHEGFSLCLGEDFNSLMQPWNLSPVSSWQQTPSECMSRPVSMHQDMFSPMPFGNGHDFGEKTFEDQSDIPSSEVDLSLHHQSYMDDAIPILDLKLPAQAGEGGTLNLDGLLKPRRMSGSSFTMSTSGAMSDMHSHDDFSTALSEAPSFSSDWPTHSNRNSMVSSTQLSPVASPRLTPQGRSELVRTQSRGRASPSPRPGVRSVPYSVEGPRNKRWSTGSYGTAPTRRPAPFMYHGGHESFRHSAQTSAPVTSHPPPMGMTGYANMGQPHYMMANANPMQRNSMLLPSQLPSQVPSQLFSQEAPRFETPPPLLSHGLLKMLQSNADASHIHGHYTDFADAPDLFAALHEEQLSPPPEDMNPSDPDMVPREQELRFEGDLYTPRWVRGHGNKREGWCGICKPGRWLVLKNSAFWYDKSFSHGVSAATGTPFQEPQGTRRMDGNPDVWEGLCGGCDEWIALVSSKKKGTTWFRHAYKCHTHAKTKDGVKRRRESGNIRNLSNVNSMRPKSEILTTQAMPTSASMGSMSMTAAHSVQLGPRPSSRHSTPVPPPQPLRTVSINPSAYYSNSIGYGNMI